MKTVIHWYRRDLRVRDNAGLMEAADGARQVIPVFCLDPGILARDDVGAPRVWFLLESLKELSEEIRRRNGRLVILRGRPEEEIPRFAQAICAEAVFLNRDYEPYAHGRDRAVAEALEQQGIGVRICEDQLLVEPEEVQTRDGRPFSVFSPFARVWREAPKGSPEGELQDFGGAVEDGEDTLPSLEDLGFRLPEEFDPGWWRPGERGALERLDFFAENLLADYDTNRDRPDRDGTSRLSPYLKFGNVSIRTVYDRCKRAAKFVDELAWREFYFHVLWHWPGVLHGAWQTRGQHLEWDENAEKLEAWKRGLTGYPVVDAGMRQLLRTGWMHNRVRMIVASFLTRDLHMNWQEGERHFARHLVDGDVAPNNGGWQWSAGTGVDPRPLRIFNPWLQGRKYDPNGAYVREWVPELKGVPDTYLHEPHRMDAGLQERCKCVIGQDYPAPIVDHDVERKVTQERYRQARDEAQTQLPL